MVTAVRPEKFEDNKLLVEHRDTLFYLIFHSREVVEKINNTYMGNRFRFFEIKNNLNTNEVYVDWSNGMTRYTYKCKCSYDTELYPMGE